MKHEQLTELEAMEYLGAMARLTPDTQAVVELGVHQGGSLVYLARHHANVYGVDPWALEGAYPKRPRMRRVYNAGNMRIAQELLDSEDLEATLIRGFSTEVAAGWDEPVGLLYIDAVHTLEAVVSDFIAWKPHLVSGAWVCFDDHNERYPGVLAAVSSLCRSDLTWIELVGTRLAVTRYGVK